MKWCSWGLQAQHTGLEEFPLVTPLASVTHVTPLYEPKKPLLANGFLRWPYTQRGIFLQTDLRSDNICFQARCEQDSHEYTPHGFLQHTRLPSFQDEKRNQLVSMILNNKGPCLYMHSIVTFSNFVSIQCPFTLTLILKASLKLACCFHLMEKKRKDSKGEAI